MAAVGPEPPTNRVWQVMVWGGTCLPLKLANRYCACHVASGKQRRAQRQRHILRRPASHPNLRYGSDSLYATAAKTSVVETIPTGLCCLSTTMRRWT